MAIEIDTDGKNDKNKFLGICTHTRQDNTGLEMRLVLRRVFIL